MNAYDLESFEDVTGCGGGGGKEADALTGVTAAVAGAECADVLMLLRM